MFCAFFFFKQKTAYEMRISDWSSDVCSSDLLLGSHCIVRSGSKAVARASARPANTVMSIGKGGIDVIQVLSGKLANRIICIPQVFAGNALQRQIGRAHV